MSPLGGPLLIAAAIDAELAAVPRNLSRAAGVRVHRCGIGGINAARALAAMLAHAQRNGEPFAHVLLIGFAGGLDPGLRVGDLVMPRRVRTTHGPTIELLDGDRLFQQPPNRASLGDLLSVDAPVFAPADKARLFNDPAHHHAAVAVDLESHAIASTCRDRGIPLTVLRAISDPAHRALPAATTRWVNARGRSRPLRVLADLFARPTLLASLLTLASDTGRARRSLADAIKSPVDRHRA